MNWVYIQSETRLFTVGHYAPDGTWYSDSDHSNREEAAERVAFLNGEQRTPRSIASRGVIELRLIPAQPKYNDFGDPISTAAMEADYGDDEV